VFGFHSEQIAFGVNFAVLQIEDKMSTAAITPETGSRGVRNTFAYTVICTQIAKYMSFVFVSFI
jgi:hypothetical protein